MSNFSQLVSSPWLNTGRSHTLLRFLLGQGFLWSDLACYLGVLEHVSMASMAAKKEPFQWVGSFFTVVALFMKINRKQRLLPYLLLFMTLLGSVHHQAQTFTGEGD